MVPKTNWKIIIPKNVAQVLNRPISIFGYKNNNTETRINSITDRNCNPKTTVLFCRFIHI